MSLANDFPHEMAQSVSIQALSAGGLYGPTYAAAVVYSCYAKNVIKNIKKTDGTDAVSSLQLYIDGHPAILSTAKITFGSATPSILKIQKLYDEIGGAYATVIYT